MFSPRSSNQTNPDSELLLKGIICALIGALVLLGPYFARSPDVSEILRQAHVVGWFVLVLGCAFLIRYGLNRARAAKGR